MVHGGTEFLPFVQAEETYGTWIFSDSGQVK
jgi:hypothetical protein